MREGDREMECDTPLEIEDSKWLLPSDVQVRVLITAHYLICKKRNQQYMSDRKLHFGCKEKYTITIV